MVHRCTIYNYSKSHKLKFEVTLHSQDLLSPVDTATEVVEMKQTRRQTAPTREKVLLGTRLALSA